MKRNVQKLAIASKTVRIASVQKLQVAGMVIFDRHNGGGAYQQFSRGRSLVTRITEEDKVGLFFKREVT